MHSSRTAHWAAFAVVALSPVRAAAGSPTASETNAITGDDACSAEDGIGCDLSLRQLRGEKRNAAVAGHRREIDDPDASSAEQEWDTDKDLVAFEADDWQNSTEWSPHGGPMLGPFCCQNGQGLGHADPHDIGGTCYASAKPDIGSFCDSSETCASACNGTWVAGFCALPQEGVFQLCDQAIHGPASARAPQDSACDSLTGCASCNGTWCPYEKEPLPHAADLAPAAASATPAATALVSEGQETADAAAGEYFLRRRHRRCRQFCRMETWHGSVRRRRCRHRCRW